MPLIDLDEEHRGLRREEAVKQVSNSNDVVQRDQRLGQDGRWALDVAKRPERAQQIISPPTTEDKTHRPPGGRAGQGPVDTAFPAWDHEPS
jgi:hypothetical protein